MNRWQRERAIMEELLRREREDLVRHIGGDRWQLTPLGRQKALEELRADYGVWAPLVRLYDRVRALWR
jgi:hypothetical protein